MNELVLIDHPGIATFSSGLVILVLGNERTRVTEALAEGFHIPWDRLRTGPPIRIGRHDAPANKLPIMPEIDLFPVMPTHEQGCVSRLHAALEWLDGKPMLRTISTVSGTWIRRSGETTKRLLLLHEYHELKHGDVIQLGHPSRVFVRLRFQFRGDLPLDS